MYINEADMFVAPYYQYAYSLPHDDVSFKFHIVNFDYFRPIDAIKLTIDVLIKPHTNRSG